MSGHVQERASALPLGTAASATLPGSNVLGFLCVTAGTITITDANGVVLLNAFPATAGTWTKIPLYVGPFGTVTLGAGCSGTLAVY